MKASRFHVSKGEVWRPDAPTEQFMRSYVTEMSQKYTEGTLVLNAPASSHQFCKKCILKEVWGQYDVEDRDNTHCVTVLKFCLGVCIVIYLLRFSPFHPTPERAKVFYAFLETSFRWLVSKRMDSKSFKERTLPIKTTIELPHRGSGRPSAENPLNSLSSSAAGCNNLVEQAVIGTS